MQLSIVIPCYNEERTVSTVLHRVATIGLPEGWTREIIIVDDCSTDGTWPLIQKLQSEIMSSTPGLRIRAARREKNGGKGAALKTGMVLAQGDFILIQDADDEYEPGDYPLLLEPIIQGKADVSFGSRILGKNSVPFNAVYFYGGLMVTKFFNLFFNTKLTDITTCYKVFPRSFVPFLSVLPSDDFSYDAVELTHQLVVMGRVTEVPIRYNARTRKAGKKLNWRHGVKCGVAILKEKLNLDGIIAHLRFRKILKRVTTGHLVDLGCGSNPRLLFALRDRIRQGSGVDRKTNEFRSDKLRIYRSNFDEENPPPFPADLQGADQAVMLAVLEHLHCPKQVLTNLHALLKPEGEILLTTPSTFSKPILEFLAFGLGIIDKNEISDHKHYFSRSELKELLRSVGFKEIEHKYFEFGMNHFVTAKK